MLALKLFVGLLGALLLVSFATQNNQTVEVSWYFDHHYQLNLWVVALGAFFLGFALTAVGWMGSLFTLGRQLRLLKKQAQALAAELDEIKQAPLPDEPKLRAEPDEGESASPALPPSTPPETRRLGGV